MAGAKRGLTRPLTVVVLLVGAVMCAFAQSVPHGSLTGKLTDLHAIPLAGVAVVLRNESTGVETRTTTAGNGGYSFMALDAGEYSIEAVSPELGRGRLEGIEITAGYQAHVLAAMEFELRVPVPLHPKVVLHDIPIQSYLVSGMLASEPVRRLVLVPMPGPESAAVPPQNIIPILNVQVTAEPPRALSVAGLSASGGVEPPTTQTVLAQILPHPTGLEIGRAVVRGAHTAMQFEVPPLRRMKFMAQKVEPVFEAVTSTVTAAELQSLPVGGRRWEEFVADTPTGAAQTGSAEPALAGAVQQSSDIAVDGASRRLAFGGGSGENAGLPAQTYSEGAAEPGGMGQAWGGRHGFGVSEAAIREVQATAGNVEARTARGPGGSVNVTTQRGSNGLHGQAFVFDRQNNLGARNPFTEWVQETAPATSVLVPVFTAKAFTPPDHEATWGLGLGGQLRRDKLFWFAALDGYQRNDPGLSTVKHPDQFFAQPSNDQLQLLGAQLGIGSIALNRYSQMLETLGGLLGPAARTATQWLGFGRIDWEAAERHHFTLETTAANWDSPGGGLTSVSEAYGNHSYGATHASEEWLLGRWEAFLTPNLMAVTQASVGRNILTAHAETPSSFEQTLNQNVWGQLPQIIVDSRYGFTIGNPARFGQGSYPDERLYRAMEAVDWIHGGMLVKAGFEVSHNADTTGLLRNQTGTYYYSSVENFVSDALVFGAFGFSDALDKFNPHNCDETGKAWRDSAGKLRGLGNLPCYAYHSQTMGPSNWQLSTNDWAGFATAQWQPSKIAVLSLGLRWEREQLPPPIATLANPALPLTARVPALGNNWGPRLALAFGGGERKRFGWPVLRVGYGMYYGRTENSTLEAALTQTGSVNGDLNFFSRPADNLNAGGAPPFPYAFSGEPLSMVKPGAVEFAPNFNNPEVHQTVIAFEETLPGHLQISASALLSLGRRLPISIDTNFDSKVNPGSITYAVVDGTGKGPIKAPQITVPFYAAWPSAGGTVGRINPGYQQITEIMSRANSTYEALVLRVNRYGPSGLSLHAHYTYAHAMDWNPNESSRVAGNNVLDPADFGREYGTSNLDVRHSASAMVIAESPWKLHKSAGLVANGWMLSGVWHFRSGLPYTMRTSGALPEEFNQATGQAIVGLGPGMNGSGGDNRILGMGNDHVAYDLGRNTFRYPAAWKADIRLGKRFNLGHMRQLELLAESLNLFNHQNVTELETTGYTIQTGSMNGGLPTLNFLTGLKANTTAFGQPLNINSTNFYRERQIQFGMRFRF